VPWNSGEDGQDTAMDLKEGMQQVIELDRSVQTSVIAARKAVVDTSSELRKLLGAGTDADAAVNISVLHTRVGAAHVERQRLLQRVKDAEERAMARRALQEVTEKVRSVEAVVGETPKQQDARHMQGTTTQCTSRQPVEEKAKQQDAQHQQRAIMESTSLQPVEEKAKQQDASHKQGPTVECTSWQPVEEKTRQQELSSLATIPALLGCSDSPRSEPLDKAQDTLFCRCRDDHTMESIGGTYVMSGHHHGRATYKRTTGSQVVLYFWDSNVAEQRGWWFGSEVGGEMVWARHGQIDSELPARPLEEPPPIQGWISCSTGNSLTDLFVQRASTPPLASEPDEEPVPRPKRCPRQASDFESDDQKKLYHWLLNLDNGLGGLLEYFELLVNEFDADLKQLAALKTGKKGGILESVEPAFWDLVRVSKAGHRVLFARGISKL